MHEITIVSSMMEIIRRTAAEHAIESISRVCLKVGELKAVEPMTLTSCFDVVAEGTVARGAELIIETVPVTARCSGCGGSFRVIKYDFTCPCCRGDRVTVVSGEELYIYSLEALCKGERHEKTAA